MKAGYKTTEFYVTLFYGAGLAVTAATSQLSPHYAALGAGAATVAYTLSRTIAKVAASWGTKPPPAPPAA